MRYIYLFIILCCLSCNNERVLLLPEIENAEVTEVLDVSPAYLFYDETQPDSTFLNRKNLIITTNWLVNVDKRLTLKQAIPHIKFLQDKKRNAKMHKNENAKNYFTCNDTGIGNLGFLEFTDVNYEMNRVFSDSIISKSNFGMIIRVTKSDSFHIFDVIPNSTKRISRGYWNINKVEQILNKDYSSKESKRIFFLEFNKGLSFQDYIKWKSIYNSLKLEHSIINNNEFIY